MRVPLSWLRELVPGLPADADHVAAAMVAAGLEVEQVQRYGDDVTGVVVGRVLDVEELTEFKKPIRYCHVDVGSAQHEVVCGATNFVAGDLVAFARPGAGLPGGFAIASRQTYGHTSDGMICSSRELGVSDEHDGILVLAPDSPLGQDVVELLDLRDEVLDIAVTPDRGYVLSMRGMAREAATAFDLRFTDPGVGGVPVAGDGYEVRLEDPTGCDRYVARVVTGLDPAAASPPWLQRRLALCGMRSISLAVDVTNHVLLELGQPLHAFDLSALRGPVVVRRATAGESLRTLDGQQRALHPEDLVITDDSGPIALAGVMGGARAEVGSTTTDLLIESAHFLPLPIARTARRHKLPSEASKRYERGVDPALAPVAAEAAVQMLVRLGGGLAGGLTDVNGTAPSASLEFPLDLPGRVAGRNYDAEVVRRRLADVGCVVTDGASPDLVQVQPPSWRPDLTGTAELVEEVVRLEGYDSIPVVLPPAPAGRGLTPTQRWRRAASRSLAASGLIEVVSTPFVSASVLPDFAGGLTPPRLLNPLAETEAVLRPSLQPGLLAALSRNVGRGLTDVALFETGLVFLSEGSAGVAAPNVSQRPEPAELDALDAALPLQARHVGIALAGRRAGRPVDWADAAEAVLDLGRALGLGLVLRAGQFGPWHPGRCAEVLLDGSRLGMVGELHPRVISALGLPERTVTAEVNLDVLVQSAVDSGAVRAPTVSSYPPSSVDVALVVEKSVSAGEVEAALRAGAGPLLEDLRLFDVYTGPQVGERHRSLAYSMRFRAGDRTLTDTEVLAARDAAVTAAAQQTAAVLRS